MWNLPTHPRCVVTAEDTTDPVVLEGTAEIVTDPVAPARPLAPRPTGRKLISGEAKDGAPAA